MQTLELETVDFIARFRDVDRFDLLCRSCPNYGKRWGCPPFEDSDNYNLTEFKKVRLFLLPVPLPPMHELPLKERIASATKIIQQERRKYEPAILTLEKQQGGLAALFTGMCPHCAAAECGRRVGEPCRHPDLVRPSLEALGFDLCRTSSELFGKQIEWISDDYTPRELSLLAAHFK